MPVLTTTDMQLLYTAGLDSLMLNWLNTMGIQIFLPVSILGLAAREYSLINPLQSSLILAMSCPHHGFFGLLSCKCAWTKNRLQQHPFFLCAVLPINLAGNRIQPQKKPNNTKATTSTFARLTISNLQKGSDRYW